MCTCCAVWTANMCLIERRVNVHKLVDKRHDTYTKAVTYEGAEHLSVYSPITSPALAGDVQQTCDRVARHLERIYDCELQQMILHFKVDHRGTLFLLYGCEIKRKTAVCCHTNGSLPPFLARRALVLLFSFFFLASPLHVVPGPCFVHGVPIGQLHDPFRHLQCHLSLGVAV